MVSAMVSRVVLLHLLTQVAYVHPHASSNNPNAPTPAPVAVNQPNCTDILAAAAARPDPTIGEQIVFLGFVPALGVLALIGGALSCATLFHRSIRVPANKYLAGIAIGDMCIGLSAVFNFAFKLLDIDYVCKTTTEAYLVKAAVYLGAMGGRVATFNLLFLGMQRVVAVWLPERLKQVVFTSFATVLMLVTTSFFIFVAPGTFEILVGEVMIYHINSTLYVQMAPSLGALYPDSTNGIILAMCLSVALVLLNLSVTIATTFGLITRRRNDEDADLLRQNHVSRVYVMVGACYGVCYLPGAVLGCVVLAVPGLSPDGEHANIFNSLDLAHYVMEILNAAVHTPLYMLCYVHFRDTVSVVLRIKKKEDAQVLWYKSDEDI